MKHNRSLNRGMRLSKERIEKDIIKLKARMNRLYVEIMARERALALFSSVADTPEQPIVATVAEAPNVTHETIDAIPTPIVEEK